MMGRKPTYKELQQRVTELEEEAIKRKEAEASLQRNEKILNHAQKIARMGTWVTDLTTGKAVMSNEMYELFDVGPEFEGDYKSIETLIHPKDREKVKRGYEEAYKGNPTQMLYRILLSDGTVRYLWGEGGHVVRDAEGKPLLLIGISQDITEQVLIQEALRESEAKAKALLNATTDIAVLLDRDGIIHAANEAVEENLGKTVKELVGTSVYDYFSPKLAASRKARIRQVLRTGNPSRFLDEDKGKYTDQSIYPVFDAKKKVVGVAVYVRDITKSRQAEQALRNRERELENKTTDLEEVNTALRVLLKKREEDKIELQKKVLFSVKELVFPYMEKMKQSNLDHNQRTLLEIIDSNLNEIATPFIQGFSSKFSKLSPAEIQVANFVKKGKITREIADLLNLSTKTIDCHRDSIRKKIGIKNRKINLRSYLASGE
jgi:PAS domain S-box-containing protein